MAIELADKTPPANMTEFIARISANPVRNRLRLKRIGRKDCIVQFHWKTATGIAFQCMDNNEISKNKLFEIYIAAIDPSIYIFDRDGMTMEISHNGKPRRSLMRFEYIETEGS